MDDMNQSIRAEIALAHRELDGAGVKEPAKRLHERVVMLIEQRNSLLFALIELRRAGRASDDAVWARANAAIAKALGD